MIHDKTDTAEPDGEGCERPSKPRRRFLKGGLAAAPAVFTMRQSYAALGSAAACVARNAQDFQKSPPPALAGKEVDSWVREHWIYFKFVSKGSSPEFSPEFYFLAPTTREMLNQIPDFGGPVEGSYYVTDDQGFADSSLKTVWLTPQGMATPIDNASPATDPACAVEDSTSTGGLSTGYEPPTRGKRPDRSTFDPKRLGETSRGPRDRSGRGVATTPPEASAATDPCASAGSVTSTTTTSDGRDRRYRGVDRPQNGAGDRIRNSGAGSTTFAETPGPIAGKARRTNLMEDPGGAPLASATDRDSDRTSRDRGRRDRGVTAPLAVESPGAPVVDASVLTPTTPSVMGGVVVYTINGRSGLFTLNGQDETNILRLYNAETDDPIQTMTIGDSATDTALTASCHVSIHPNGGMA